MNDTMIMTTTSTLDGHEITEYLGICIGETILGANIVRDFMASITDIVGGRSTAYEQSLRQARDMAMQEMVQEAQSRGANAVIGIDIDYETVGQGSMMMVTASGTAVRTTRTR